MKLRTKIALLSVAACCYLAAMFLFISTMPAGLVHAAAAPPQYGGALVTWSPPTAYPDGVMMPATDYKDVTIRWSIAGTGQLGVVSVPVVPAQLQIATPCGVYTFVGTYTTTHTAHVPDATQTAPAVTFDSGKICPTPVPPGALVVL